MHIVLNSFGASIGQENSLFAVSTAEGKQLIAPRDVKSITVSRGARISSDAVLLAIQNEVDVIFVDSTGKPQGRVWSIRYGSVSDIRRRQLDFLYSSAAVDWVKELVVEKINGQVALLLALQLDQADATKRRISTVLNRLEDYKNKVRRCEGEYVSDLAASLRGWEGAASRYYFKMIAECLPEKYRFSERTRQPATDYFNAMLNYGYGMLYGKVEGALVKAGLDPYTGIFHRDDYNRPALVFDVIERYRTWVDYVVVQLCRQDAMTEECFAVREDGAVLLEGLGKRIVIQSVNDYLAEVISWKGVDRSRAEHIQLDAHRLATFFMNQSPPEMPAR
ncbi:MAG: CRISPR-associated endonuclease Cas1 [Bacteroidetes bacterium]|nr:MAG: CRISPR-associated endonuclease Cas1 [Bacteroidota bacterium]